MRKNSFILALFLSVSALLAVCLASPRVYCAEIVDEIEAVVDGKPIARSEVDSIARQAGNPEDPAIREAAFGIVVNQTLILLEAQKRKISVTGDEVDSAIESFRRRTGLDILSLRGEVEASGKNWRDFREEFRTQITVSRLGMDIIRQEYKSEEAAQREYFIRHYDEFKKGDWVRLLHLSLPGESAETAEKVRAAALAGGDFAKEAVSLSGWEAVDTGKLEVKDLTPALKDAVAQLAAGGVTPVLTLGGEAHLFYLAEKENGKVAFEDVKEEVAAKFRERGLEEVINNWLMIRRDDARIVRMR
ncbi:peptidyl-prolyl cis-trans isomerase [bacterium]|nr:MAG: peptidyl-prolyl cis-trans isomerase [bacterium]